MINGLSGTLPLYIVTEYPKSGGTWFGQMLSAYLNVPFPRNRRPEFKSCIMHAHLRYSPLMRNVTCVIRDGRDVVVSWYYHSLFPNERNSPYLVEKTRRENPFRDYDDITANLPRFIEYLFTVENRRLFHFNWNEFIESWTDKQTATFVKYEDLVADAASALRPVVEKLTGTRADMQRLQEIREQYSFKRLAKREPGSENRASFMRKGIVGDWRNHFDRAACEVFGQYAGDTLIKLGYETDQRWIQNTSERRSPAEGKGIRVVDAT